MLIDRLCSPALIYLAFSMIQLILDLSNNKFRLAVAKLIVAIIFTYILNVLCDQKMSILSWIIVFIPFLFMGYFSLLLTYALGFSEDTPMETTGETSTETPDEAETESSSKEDFKVTAFEPYTGTGITRVLANKNNQNKVNISKEEPLQVIKKIQERFTEDLNRKEKGN